MLLSFQGPPRLGADSAYDAPEGMKKASRERPTNRPVIWALRYGRLPVDLLQSHPRPSNIASQADSVKSGGAGPTQIAPSAAAVSAPATEPLEASLAELDHRAVEARRRHVELAAGEGLPVHAHPALRKHPPRLPT